MFKLFEELESALIMLGTAFPFANFSQPLFMMLSTKFCICVISSYTHTAPEDSDSVCDCVSVSFVGASCSETVSALYKYILYKINLLLKGHYLQTFIYNFLIHEI